MNPRGGQSGSGASQRLEQWSDATFCKRDEDVAVELDVGDVLERAVGGEHAFLVLAAEQGDLDLLTLVLVRVVLHGAERSRSVRAHDRRFLGTNQRFHRCLPAEACHDE